MDRQVSGFDHDAVTTGGGNDIGMENVDLRDLDGLALVQSGRSVNLRRDGWENE
jgi:hypothetical protein